MDRKPTILDVARRAGVSVGTASNVLNDRGNVSEARRTQVATAVARLGYVPNRVAQSLRRSESRVIGLCAPLTSSAYFAALLETFEELAAQQGYEIMQVLSRGDPALELRRVRALVGRHVDGLILIPSFDSRETLQLLSEQGTPTVLVDRVTGDRRFDSVAIDDRKAMREATRHLIRLGHRRLLYLVRDPRLPTTQRRIEGYRDAAAAAKPSIDAALCQRDADDAAFERQIKAAMSAARPPTALIASNSAIALSMLHALQRLGIRWPDDVSLLSFDEPAWAPIVTPALAVIRHPTRRMTLEAWRRLLARIRTPDAPPSPITFHARLIPAASLGPPGHARKRASPAHRR